MKCDNCGANLQTTNDRKLQFCPYCGNTLVQYSEEHEFKKFLLNHEEDVRRTKVRENDNRERNEIYRGIIAFIALFGFIFLMIVVGFRLLP